MKKGEMRVALEIVRDEMQQAANNACPACYSGDVPVQDDDGRWWHEEYDDFGDTTEDRECDAQDIWGCLRSHRSETRPRQAN